ncbi:MAG TPA: futalosine synthase [Nitrospirae bacterium]|nr:futalosine synthase [Nitrospirota bacterium]
MLKIGKIPYTNLYPIYYFLEMTSGSKYEFIEGVPSDINRLLREGRIDISPSSSIEYLRRPEKYILINNHSVSSEGPVGSILLFSRRPVETLGGFTVLYTHQSETSAALLRIVLSRFYQLQCSLKSSGLPLEEGLRNHSAYLLIGDDALMEAHKSPNLYIYDLGDIWYRKTGLPFVFALWIANRGAGAELKSFITDLDEAKDRALKDLPKVAGTCPFRKWLSEKELIAYWKKLSYDFDDKHRQGLELFDSYIREMGI